MAGRRPDGGDDHQKRCQSDRCRHPGVRSVSGVSRARATSEPETPKLTLFWNPYICRSDTISGDHAAAEGRGVRGRGARLRSSTPAASLQDLARRPTPWSPAEMLDLPPGPAYEYAQLITRQLSCGHPARKERDHRQSSGHPAGTVSSRTGVPPSRGRPPPQPRGR